jgi:hypothetical protein
MIAMQANPDTPEGPDKRPDGPDIAAPFRENAAPKTSAQDGWNLAGRQGPVKPPARSPWKKGQRAAMAVGDLPVMTPRPTGVVGFRGAKGDKSRDPKI